MKPTLKNLKQAVGQVLLRPQPMRASYENRKPTQDELDEKWRLEKRRR